MLSENVFKECLVLLCENFNFEVSSAYVKMVYGELKNSVSDRDMLVVTKRILKDVSSEDWSSSYGYRGKPALADWIEAYEPPKKKWKCDESTGFKVIEDISNNLRLK